MNVYSVVKYRRFGKLGSFHLQGIFFRWFDPAVNRFSESNTINCFFSSAYNKIQLLSVDELHFSGNFMLPGYAGFYAA
jgi:hypothetical protein